MCSQVKETENMKMVKVVKVAKSVVGRVVIHLANGLGQVRYIFSE